MQTVSGTATADTTAWIELPEGLPIRDPQLQIVLGPNMQRSLLDVVLGTTAWCRGVIDSASPGIDTTTSDVLASLALLRMMNATQQAGGPEAGGLDSRIRSAVATLLATQNEDGGWTWSGTSRAESGE